MSLLQSMSTRGKLLLGASVAGIAVLAFTLVSQTRLGMTWEMSWSTCDHRTPPDSAP